MFFMSKGRLLKNHATQATPKDPWISRGRFSPCLFKRLGRIAVRIKDKRISRAISHLKLIVISGRLRFPNVKVFKVTKNVRFLGCFRVKYSIFVFPYILRLRFRSGWSRRQEILQNLFHFPGCFFPGRLFPFLCGYFYFFYRYFTAFFRTISFSRGLISFFKVIFRLVRFFPRYLRNFAFGASMFFRHVSSYIRFVRARLVLPFHFGWPRNHHR